PVVFVEGFGRHQQDIGIADQPPVVPVLGCGGEPGYPYLAGVAFDFNRVALVVGGHFVRTAVAGNGDSVDLVAQFDDRTLSAGIVPGKRVTQGNGRSVDPPPPVRVAPNTLGVGILVSDVAV